MDSESRTVMEACAGRPGWHWFRSAAPRRFLRESTPWRGPGDTRAGQRMTLADGCGAGGRQRPTPTDSQCAGWRRCAGHTDLILDSCSMRGKTRR